MTKRFSSIRQLLCRRKQPSTIAGALEILVGSDLVKRAALEVSACDLIETMALELFQNSDNLLSQTAELLNLRSAIHVTVPTADLVESLGIDISQLKRLNALPQPSVTAPSGKALLIADPSQVSIGEFESCGVAVFLSLGSTITEIWRQYDELHSTTKRQLNNEQVIALLQQLISLASSRGAKALLLGEPSPEQYSFFAFETRFVGEISPVAISEVDHFMQTTPQFSITLDGVSFEISIRSLSNGSASTTLEVSWTVAARSVKDSQFQAQGAFANNISPREANSKPTTFSRPLIDTDFLVMIVDDDHRFSFILRKVLESKGYRVHMQTSSEAAFEELESGAITPDAVICDVHMPVLDGLTFVRECRRQAIDYPFIMLTSDPDYMLEAEAVLHGADAYLRKQDDPCVLLAWITAVIRKHKSKISQTQDAQPPHFNRHFQGMLT